MFNQFCITFSVINIAIISTKGVFFNFQDDISFVFYDEENKPIFKSNSIHDEIANNTNCNQSDNITFIVHGWMESCDTEWTQAMIQNINIFRPGCIVCMNYSLYSKNSNYFRLVAQFDGIAEVLANKLRQFQNQGFDPSNYFMFGFSFGGHLVTESGRRLGHQLIDQIDVCEPAGPGFDGNISFNKLSPIDAAKNVQCIHTSSDKGTSKRNCHQNWEMGYCGRSQVAAGPRPMGSHGLCPYFYNSAFRNEFLAIPPKYCKPTARYAKTWPLNYRMGYFQERTNLFNGSTFYADTFKCPPYNLDPATANQIS